MGIFTSFGLKNQTQHRAEGHESLFSYMETQDCAFVQFLDYNSRCDFVMNNPNCEDGHYLRDYMIFVYCNVGRTTLGYGLGLFVLLAFICYMFSIAADTIGRFFCPALAAISHMLHLGEAVSGVTLLAFGNGISDLFGSWINIYGDTTGVYASNFGCCIFTLAVTSATICIIHPFRLFSEYFTRDFIFLMFATIYINHIMRDGTVNMTESYSILLIYLIYVIMIIIDQAILVGKSRELQKKIVSVTVERSLEDAEIFKEMVKEMKDQLSFSILDKNTKSVVNVELTRSASFVSKSPNSRLFKQFVHSLNPIRRTDWRAAGVKGKVFLILKAPLIFALLLVIPVIDYSEEVHGWSKLLNVCQVIITPMLILYRIHLLTMAVFLCIFAFGIPLAAVVFITSRTDIAPPFHSMFAVLSATACILTIGHLTLHLSSILTTLGIAMQTTDTFISVTISSWAGSFIGLISNITLARRGYHKMGFAACVGGPIFNITISFGVNFLFKCYRDPEKLARVRQGTLADNIYLFVVLIILFSSFYIAFTGSQVRKSMGVALLCIYGFFMFLVILIEFEHIHGYSTSHHEQRINVF